MPDFIAPPPQGPTPEFERELERVRATPAAQVRRELRWCFSGRRTPDVARAILAQPEQGAAAIAAALEVYWERALAPHWTRVRALLEAEIAHRGRALAERGPLGLFADLHPDLVWRDGTLEVHIAFENEADLAGRGLLLVPCAFGKGIATISDAPWQPTVVYPAPGAGALWEPAGNAPGRAALSALLGDHARAVGLAARQPGRGQRAPAGAEPRRPRDPAPRRARGAVPANRGGRRARGGGHGVGLERAVDTAHPRLSSCCAVGAVSSASSARLRSSPPA